MEAVRVEPDAIADVEVADAASFDRSRAAIVETDVDPVAGDALAVVAFEIVARDRPARRAGAGHGGAPEPVAELVADHRAQNAADDRPRTGALRPRANRLVRRDRADVIGARRGRLRDARGPRGHRLGRNRRI